MRYGYGVVERREALALQRAMASQGAALADIGECGLGLVTCGVCDECAEHDESRCWSCRATRRGDVEGFEGRAEFAVVDPEHGWMLVCSDCIRSDRFQLPAGADFVEVHVVGFSPDTDLRSRCGRLLRESGSLHWVRPYGSGELPRLNGPAVPVWIAPERYCGECKR